MTVVRIGRGQPRPAQADLQVAIAHDRERLHLAPPNHLNDIAVAGPYAIVVDGQELDEYVVWEW